MKYLFGGAAVLLLSALSVWALTIFHRSELAEVIEQMQKICVVNVDERKRSSIDVRLEAVKTSLKGGASVESQEKLVQGALADGSADKSAADSEIRRCMTERFKEYLKSRPAK